ncbi:MAG: hypothetical protein N4A71_16860 [Carboxylicivirga sp.]|jgi:hypothetical protein|nr:hypothetical protein [Carboxylicivirga sp.]
MRRYLITFLLVLSVILQGAFAQTTNRDVEPIVSITMEQAQESSPYYLLHGQESIIKGIHGQAKYFFNREGENNYIRLNNSRQLNTLWENQTQGDKRDIGNIGASNK